MIDYKEKHSFLGIPVPPLPEACVPITKPNLDNFPNKEDYALFRIKGGIKQEIIDQNPQLGPTFEMSEPPPMISADLTLVCYEMAKLLRRNPAQIAEDLATGYNSSSHLSVVEKAEPQNGYLNFKFNPASYATLILEETEKHRDRYGEQNLGNGGTVVIDCSSPNVAKYMSLGHLRSTIIGESLSRINRATGYDVIRDNHIGDWGTQFGMLTRAYELWGDEYEEIRDNTNPLMGLFKLYTRITSEVEEEKKSKRQQLGLSEKDDVESSLEKEGRTWFKRLESGDKEALRLLQWATELSFAEYRRIYGILGTEYEYYLGESYYFGMLPKMIGHMKEKGLATEEETGAISVDLSDKNLKRLVIQKSDGTSLYSGRDLATLVCRSAWFNPKRILYVVGDEQQGYFKEVFAAFDKMTGGNMPELEHVSFGLIRLPTGKMSTRAGNIIFLEDVLNEASKRAEGKINEVNKKLSSEEKEKISRQVGVGAVVFSDLGQSKDKTIQFEWDRALSFDGRSGPYIQYAYARTQALLRRAAEENIDIRQDLPAVISGQPEYLLIKQISRFPEAIEKAATTNSPDVIADNIYKIASVFSEFYKNYSIFGENDESKRNTRLRLTQATSRVLKKGLNLICIEAPDRM